MNYKKKRINATSHRNQGTPPSPIFEPVAAIQTHFRKKPKFVSKKALDITDLPPELIMEIIKIPDPCTATCLGLTCKGFYKILEDQYKTPIDLDVRPHYPYPWLWEILGPWIGPEYRISGVCLTVRRFLLKSVYGGHIPHMKNWSKGRYTGDPEDLLGWRHEASRMYKDFHTRIGRQEPSHAPNPYNLGPVVWHEKTVEAIKKDLMGFKNSIEWGKCVRYWKHSLTPETRAPIQEALDHYAKIVQLNKMLEGL